MTEVPLSCESIGDLRAIYQPPSHGAVAKTFRHLDHHCRRFIELSPFLCMGTLGPDGLGDVTPRGGEPGFVHVLDSSRLAMPDRPGNNRLDSLSNLTTHPGVGLLFLIPGFEEALRVNGRARITTDAALMNRFIVDGKPPRTVIVIEVSETYFHCGKAIRRAGLWEASAQVDRRSFPTMGKVYRDQLALEKDAAAIDDLLERDARENLY